MNFEDVMNAMNKESDSALHLANVVVSTYWQDKRMSLYSLNAIHKDYRRLVYDVMEYRLNPDWDDDEFHALAVYAKDIVDPPFLHHSLTSLKPLVVPKRNKKQRVA